MIGKNLSRRNPAIADSFGSTCFSARQLFTAPWCPYALYHKLYTPGFRYASLDVAVSCTVKNAWQIHGNGSEEIPCHKAEITTLGYV